MKQKPQHPKGVALKLGDYHDLASLKKVFQGIDKLRQHANKVYEITSGQSYTFH